MKSMSYHTRKQTLFGTAAILASLVGLSTVQAGTTAWWRFEEGPAGAQIPHPTTAGVFYGAIADSSGNGNDLSVWDESGAGYVYRTQVASSTLPLTGDPNNFSVKNSGGFPAMWATNLESWTPAAWTVEATFKLENGGYRTIVGRDSQGSVTTGNLDLAALYFQAVPNNALAIKFSDVSGYWHEAISAENIFTSFDFPSDNDGDTAPWYSMAAVSDGSTLSLFLRNVSDSSGWDLIAQTDMTLSGSPDTTLTAGAGDGGDWDAGDFSVGRGLYAGGHGDRAWGYIDEVRLSDMALSPTEFVLVPEPSTVALATAGLGAMFLAIRRRRRD